MLALKLADAVFGVIGAVVYGVEWGVLAGELGAHPEHESLELLRGVEASGYAGLVGDDDQAVAERLGGAAEGEDAVDEADVGGIVEVADFVVDYAVAVKEEGWMEFLRGRVIGRFQKRTSAAEAALSMRSLRYG